MSISVTTRSPTDGAVQVIERWRQQDLVSRMWAKDGTVWFDPVPAEIEDRLGWLDLPNSSRDLIGPVRSLAAEAATEGITDVILCGMGGSSLAPEVFASTFPHGEGTPKLTVVDTTHPTAITEIGERIDPATTWFVISSKSGGTLETMSLFHHFWRKVSMVDPAPGHRFIAITDPGSSLETTAADRNFRATLLADATVGGRYSAMSAFGLVPAGLIGIDIERLLDAAADAARQCSPGNDSENPGLAIGAMMGAAGVDGRAARFSGTAPAKALPAWIEQLIAESTGKQGRGILPIADGACTGTDLMTVDLGAGTGPSCDVSIAFGDPHDIAGAMFVLEFATAVAGEALDINPFDQPDVQLAKSLAHDAMQGNLGSGGPVPLASTDPAIRDWIDSHVSKDPEYVAIHAYLPPGEDVDLELDRLAAALAARAGSCVTIGYGPRFLHSTGQLHKGGQDGGVFIQLLAGAPDILPVPEADYSFNDLIAAQAAGDGAALAERGRAVISIDLGVNVSTNLTNLVDRFAGP